MLSPGALHDAVCSVLTQAAEQAVMPRFRRLAQHEIRNKGAAELVTVADHESEAILAEGLSKILPEATIVGEEAADLDSTVLERLSGRLCWIIDPLDGTANFAAGQGPFGIMVALADCGEPIGGWIHDPRSGQFCVALKGHGTLINGKRVVARGGDGPLPVAAISSLFLESTRHQAILKQLHGSFATVPIPRCAADQYPRMILGQSDITLFERTLAWDHAAGILCLTEAGGKVTRFNGSPYRVDDQRRGLIAAATPVLWQRVADLLQDVG